MSGANAAPAAPDITLDELERLIRILGMLGSAHDGEALNAARLAVRWLAAAGTDWRALLTPEPELAVVGVGVADEARVQREEIAGLRRELAQAESREKAAYRKGVGDGLTTMAKQLKAQAQPSLGALGQQWAGLAAQPAQPLGATAAQAPAGNPFTPYTPPPPNLGATNKWPAGSWQYVAWNLLFDPATPPGVFRGSRERDFVADVLGRGFPRLTSAQETWLRDIAGRAGMSW